MRLIQKGKRMSYQKRTAYTPGPWEIRDLGKDTEQKYTPGPWVVGWGGNLWIVTDGRGCRVAAVGLEGSIPERFEEANARLIVKAPELAQAVRDLLYGVAGHNASVDRERAIKLLAEVEGAVHAL